jgi:hypothetical protein
MAGGGGGLMGMTPEERQAKLAQRKLAQQLGAQPGNNIAVGEPNPSAPPPDGRPPDGLEGKPNVPPATTPTPGPVATPKGLLSFEDWKNSTGKGIQYNRRGVDLSNEEAAKAAYEKFTGIRKNRQAQWQADQEAQQSGPKPFQPPLGGAQWTDDIHMMGGPDKPMFGQDMPEFTQEQIDSIIHYGPPTVDVMPRADIPIPRPRGGPKPVPYDPQIKPVPRPRGGGGNGKGGKPKPRGAHQKVFDSATNKKLKKKGSVREE